MSFKKLELDSKLLRALDAGGFAAPTEIQREAIPVVLSGHDLMASAQTGTGKTAAFVLPALQQLLRPSPVGGKGPRVLVLTPTRELAMQVNDSIRQFSRFCRFTTGNVVGGMAYPPQIRLLNKALDLLVATPGRLMDHMEQGRVDFSRLEILVLDEADRMLDMGFVDAVKAIAGATPAARQTLLFSATLEGKVLAVAKRLMKDPVRVQLAANHQQHASINQQVHRADDIAHKHSLLSHYLESDALKQAVIFTATKRGADKLARVLSNQGHTSAALHGDMGQGARKRTIERMRRRKFRFLVATDVAARGLHIEGISHVFNFDLPMVAEDYIHRIGRTGRAGAKGTAISLVGPDDWFRLGGIERLTGRKLEQVTIPGLEPATPAPRVRRAGSGGGKNSRRYAGGKLQAVSQNRSRGGNGNRSANPPKGKHGTQNNRSAQPKVRANARRSPAKNQRQHYRSQPLLG